MRLQLLPALWAVCFLPANPACAESPSEDAPLALETRRVTLSDTVKDGARVGRIRIRGMLELPAVNVRGIRFTQLSDLAWDDDEKLLYIVSDKGALFWLRPVIERDMLTGLELIRALRLKEIPAIATPGGATSRKANRTAAATQGRVRPLRGARIDAEGMIAVNERNGVRHDTKLLISFERHPRIVRYRPDGTAEHEYPLPAPLNNVKSYQRSNRMLEAVCLSPVHGILTAPESALINEINGYTRIFSLKGKSWLYPVSKGSNIVSMEAIGQDGILVLERDFTNAATRVVITLKKVKSLPAIGRAIPAGIETLAVLDSRNGLLLDNFEGLTHHQGNFYFLISDNNDIFLQRTLLLYIELIPE